MCISLFIPVQRYDHIVHELHPEPNPRQGVVSSSHIISYPSLSPKSSWQVRQLSIYVLITLTICQSSHNDASNVRALRTKSEGLRCPFDGVSIRNRRWDCRSPVSQCQCHPLNCSLQWSGAGNQAGVVYTIGCQPLPPSITEFVLPFTISNQNS